TDDLGNSGSGGPLSATDTVAITVNYNAPSLSTSAGPTVYTEKNPATPGDAGLTLSPGTLCNLNRATGQSSGNYASGEDVLTFVNGPGMGNIAGSWNAGVLTLVSAGNSATFANWQAALRSVTYRDTSIDPSTAMRDVTFAVTDGVTTQSAV